MNRAEQLQILDGMAELRERVAALHLRVNAIEAAASGDPEIAAAVAEVTEPFPAERAPLKRGRAA